MQLVFRLFVTWWVSMFFLFSCNTSVKYKEEHRPQFHFSPEAKWMNDPNGLVYYDGEYHLFYQFYPDSTIWGPMHWGHAVSPDLVHWEQLPIALYPDSLGFIFSGGAVIDWNNTSGLKSGDHPPMVAIYSQKDDTEVQSIAFSHDKGRSFEKYEGNPVILNPDEKDFRDPKVSWIEKYQKWIMALAVGQKINFYSSDNLLTWNFLSQFGTEDGSHIGTWECPDLFSLEIAGVEKWVLIVNLNAGSPNYGSGTQYFIGDFDGEVFTNDNSRDTILWLGYGPDNYAGVTWSDIPKEDNRRILIGWMNNWVYAQQVPTVRWRSAMTLPRSLSLRNSEYGIRLCAQPVEELKSLRKSEITMQLLEETDIFGLNELIMKIDLVQTTAESFGFIFSNELGEQLEVGFERTNNRFYIDRSASGKTSFSNQFERRHFAPRIASDSTLKWQMFLDHSSLELFADDGMVTMTETFFPNENFTKTVFFENGGKVHVENCQMYELNAIW